MFDMGMFRQWTTCGGETNTIVEAVRKDSGDESRLNARRRAPRPSLSGLRVLR